MNYEPQTGSGLTLVTIVGPTAVGKTALALQLATLFDTAILSADSRQLYRELNIGTAKPSATELAAVPHYFINSHSIQDSYTAGDYEKQGLALLDSLFETRNVVILVGGSGLFVDAICRGLDDLPKPKTGIRERLNGLHQEKGLPYLQQLLYKADPSFYKEADIHNPQRVIRALEVYESTGIPFSKYRRQQQKARNFRVLKIGLNTERSYLYERINNRVDNMIQHGLIEEVRSLLPYRHLPSLLSVGYMELFDYLDGNITLNDAIGKIKQHTRQYAKRQITWFKKDEDTHWFDPENTAIIETFIKEYLHKT